MWNTTPVWLDWSKCSPCRATTSNRSSTDRARRSSDSRWSVATRCFSAPSSGEEPAARPVVVAVGQELQSQERVSGPAPAQIELDRVGRPLAGSVADHDEVDGEPTERPRLGQPLADPLGRLADQPGVRGIGREPAAEVALSAGAPEHLIVGRQQLDAAVRPSPELHAGAEQLLAEDPLLDDSAVRPRTSPHRHPSAPWPTRAAWPVPARRSRARRSASGSVADPGQVDQGVAGTGHALVGLDDHLADATAGRRACRRSLADRRPGCAGSRHRAGAAPPHSANSRRHPLFVPRSASRGSAPYIGMPRTQGEVTFELGGVVRQQVAVLAVRVSAPRSWPAVVAAPAASRSAAGPRSRRWTTT